VSETVSKFDVQPMPTGDGTPVTAEVVNFIQRCRKFWILRPIQSMPQAQYLILSVLAYLVKQRDGIKADEEALGKAIEVIEAQSAAGLKKYGTVLKTNNGRDALLDAIQELADALQYATQEQMQREERQK
jgi:hypothetical protein